MNDPAVFIHPTAEVSAESQIGSGTRIWHQAQVLGDAIVGADCTLGKGVFVAAGVVMGRLVKLGNYANVFGGVIADEAFIGPQACLLTDRAPRSTNLDGTRKGHHDYVSAPPTIQRGASIGAGAIIMPGVTVGPYALVSAGAVIHKDVPAHALMVGNPARQVGFVCHCGQRLDENLACACGRVYRMAGERVVYGSDVTSE